MASFISFLGQIGFARQVQQHLPFAEPTSNNAIPLAHALVAFLMSVVVGARRFAHTEWLRADKVLHAMLGIARFPSDDTIRNFFLRFKQADIEAFWRPLWRWLRTVRADSGFFDGVLLDFLEGRSLPYVVVARLTSTLKRHCAGIKDWTEIDEHHAAGEFTVKLFGWSQQRRFVVIRERIRETKAAVGRRLIDVPGYTFRVWVKLRARTASRLSARAAL